MQMQLEGAGQALGTFWQNIRGARRRDPAPQPAAMPSVMVRDTPSRPSSQGISRHVAAAQQASRRQVIRAEDLLDSYIKSLRPADYAFRLLKDEFDELCAEAEIAPVSDKQVAYWLRDRGHRRYRDGWPKVTMYKIGRGRRKAA